MPDTPADDTLDAVADFAASLPSLSRPIIADYFRVSHQISVKADLSPVTLADSYVESALREAIKSRFPHHGIIGEEDGGTASASSLTWVIDPIDGTRAFSCGNPMFGTLIAVVDSGRPIIGVIDLPMFSQTWLGVSGRPTLLNGVPCKTSAIADLASARLATTSSHALGNDLPIFRSLSAAVRVTNYGGDSANYGYLSSGWCDLVAESQLQSHDILAMVPVIEGAGGVMTSWDGRAINLSDFDGTVLASANSDLHGSALDLLRGI